MNLIEIVSIITVFQLVLRAVVLSTWKQNARLSHRLLVAFMFVNTWLITKYVAFGFESLPLQWMLLYFPGICERGYFAPFNIIIGIQND